MNIQEFFDQNTWLLKVISSILIIIGAIILYKLVVKVLERTIEKLYYESQKIEVPLEDTREKEFKRVGLMDNEDKLYDVKYMDLIQQIQYYLIYLDELLISFFKEKCIE